MIDTGMKYFILSAQTFTKALVNIPEERKIKRQEGKNVITHLKI